MNSTIWPFGSIAIAEHEGAVPSFSGPFRWMSNFVGNVAMHGIPFSSVEAAFVAAKIDAPTSDAKAWLDGIVASILGDDLTPARADIIIASCGGMDIGPDDSKMALTAARTALANLAPGKAKKVGRALPLRNDWESLRDDGLMVKEWTLLTLVRRKFAADPTLATKLLATGDRLILEGNTWGDRTWGVIDTRAGVEGANRMGAILMAIREERGGAGVPGFVPEGMPRYTGRGL